MKPWDQSFVLCVAELTECLCDHAVQVLGIGHIVWLLGGALEGVGLHARSSGNMSGVSPLSEYCKSGVKLSLPGERSGVSSESTVLGGALRLQAGSEDVCSGNMGGVSSKSSMSECCKSGVSLSLSGERC